MTRSEKLKSILDKEVLSFFFACTCVIILPVYIWYIPPFMILWLLSRILETRGKLILFFKKESKTSRLFFLFIFFYLWQLVSLLYSNNFSNGWNIFISRLSLFLFPFVLVYPGEKVFARAKFLLKLFAWSTVGFIIFCYLHSFLESVFLKNGVFVFNPHPPEAYWTSYFYGPYFAVNHHPSYLSMYVIISLFIALESVFENRAKGLLRVMWIVISFILLSSIYFLSSRSGILLVVLLCPAYFYIRLKQKRNKIIVVLSILMFLFTLVSVTRSNERIKILIAKITAGSLKQNSTQFGRLEIWKAAFKIAEDNLLFGVGVGDVRQELMKEYRIMNNKELIENKYNAHNQFIEIVLEGGIIELALFLSVIGYMIFIAISEKNLLYGIFIITMLVFFMFESLLYRLSGVAFFSLFSIPSYFHS